jgi:GxxExxY protein
MQGNEITEAVIGAAIEVHRRLGPGLLESIYRHCLLHELRLRGLAAEAEVSMPVRYKDLTFDSALRLDLLVEQTVVVELKAVESLSPVFKAQLLSYLRMSGLKLGLLINFNVRRLADGVTRVVNDF